MSHIFASLYSLRELNFTDFSTFKVLDMSFMLVKNPNKSFIDISNFDLSNVNDMSSMFNGCEKIEKIYGIKKFRTKMLYISLRCFIDLV